MSGRFHDWETRLADYLASIAAAIAVDPDALGQVPCARFAAGAVEAQTGVDHYAPFRGKYKTETGSAKALRRIGAGSLEKTFDRYLEARQGPAFAQRGDIVWNGKAVGVCVGDEAVFVGNGIIGTMPRVSWVKAWATDSVVG